MNKNKKNKSMEITVEEFDNVELQNIQSTELPNADEFEMIELEIQSADISEVEMAEVSESENMKEEVLAEVKPELKASSLLSTPEKNKIINELYSGSFKFIVKEVAGDYKYSKVISIDNNQYVISINGKQFSMNVVFLPGNKIAVTNVKVVAK